MTCGGIELDELRMKRSGWRLMTSRFFDAREMMVWCIVGTAVYQVGLASSIQPKNFSALKPGVQNTCEPAASGASTPAIRPWMWNSGMMFSPQSVAVNCSVLRMLLADAARLPCDSGTILGREVVPEVCSTIDTSSICAYPPFGLAVPPAPDGSVSVKLPAPAAVSGTSRSSRRTPELASPPRPRARCCPARRSAPWRSGPTGRTRTRRRGRPGFSGALVTPLAQAM
jgi:hypothetical protein